MISVVIVTYNSADVILDCIDSLVVSEDVPLRIVIVDNASSDETISLIRDWSTLQPISFDEQCAESIGEIEAECTLLKLSANIGFAGAVNQGISFLQQDPKIDLFWVLNPDCVVATTAARHFRERADAVGRFSFIGSRILYREAPNLIQSDGGRFDKWTGICRNINQGIDPETATRPDPETLDFVSGASMVVSRLFIETMGLMREDYFLYFEEVEWATRRGDLPIILCEKALVHHHGGTSIGSGSVTRLASPLSMYFNYRNRMRFVRQAKPMALPIAYAASLARVCKMVMYGDFSQAQAALLGLLQLPPPKSVRSILSKDAARYAFGPQASKLSSSLECHKS